MTTEIEKLPLLQVSYGSGLDEDFYLPLSFFLADGVTPVPVAGITFAVQLGFGGSLLPAPTVSATGTGSILLSSLASVGPAAWAAFPGPGTYVMTLTASDGTNTRDVLQLSQYQLGVPAPPYVAVVSAASSL